MFSGRITVLFHLSRLAGIALIFGLCFYSYDGSLSQETVPVRDATTPVGVPKGVEVMARGPVHEAFASPATEPATSPLVAKKPPANIEEMPPEEKPEGDVVWIAGYWSWDDDRNDYLWVSGCWRTKPPGKEWVPGYWREQGERWQWVAGFWANSQPPQATQQVSNPVTYYPQPPAPPAVAPPPPQPGPDMVYVPGYWVWQGDRYVWRAGFWRPIREGYVWVPAHYRWTPFGYVFVEGYWDLAVARRGMLYAPVVVDVAVAGPGFVFVPTYAVCDTIVLDALFIRPAYCHYYFGDYYGPRYVGLGFETCVVFGRTHYEPIIAYCAWENRANPAWLNVQINLVSARNEGRVPLPPRTLVQQTNITNITNVTNVRNVTNVTNVLAPAKTVAAARGQKIVTLPPAARTQAMQSARNVQLAAVQQRQKTEIPTTAAQMAKPRTANLNVPPLPGKSAPPPVTNAKTPVNNPAGNHMPPGGNNTPPGHNPMPGNTGPRPPTGPGNPPPKGPPAHKPPPPPPHKAPPKEHPRG
jgi:hypothetical protein